MTLDEAVNQLVSMGIVIAGVCTVSAALILALLGFFVASRVFR
jgi:hypothetical protein